MIAELIARSEAAGYWTLQAEIIAANAGSRALHEGCGFRQVGYREQIGVREGVWHDTVLFERRSRVVGGLNLPTIECTNGAAEAD